MFSAEYRKVVDENLPVALRYRKFLHCLEWYCYLTRQGFQETYLRLGREVGFDWLNKPDEPKLLKAAALLHEERVNFLKKLRGFSENRAKEKAQGQGQPRKAQLKTLYSSDWLLTHDSKTQRQH